MSAAATAESVRRSRARLTPRALILTVIVTALLVYLAIPVRAYLEQRDRLAELERQTLQIERENADLQEEIARLNDPGYIEQLARERLQMARPGEITFVVVPGEPGPQP